MGVEVGVTVRGGVGVGWNVLDEGGGRVRVSVGEWAVSGGLGVE